ncbi:MAG TPA: isoprenyl transferase [Candidatus Marinimicrobia bacterium]|jgi:undecaprenyl diphosphate synthase|nr:isoprenyl transferase [Candidatus Neomarinimicrobiota bacterium]HIB26558.1 isoprenyl transferase [Candidatus Neomarinimicrobiota bacterium]|tara:strand:- start:96 stop:848 length:753 start_codon:yes stop_codon:yes gene_type:complete
MNKSLREKIVEQGNLPAHIAIIMDGNGRWAKANNLPRVAGHVEGINSVREIVQVCGEIGVSYLTLYTFSNENWKRPQKEVSAIMKLLLSTIKKEVGNLNKNNVRLSTIGNINNLPDNSRQGILEGIEVTKNNTGLNLILALNYSSRQELLMAVQRIADKILSGEMNSNQISEAIFSRELYTVDIPDPDLLIRTGGESRISNFLLWQLAYTEFFLTDIHWPDFREEDLLNSIIDYQGRQRRFGQIEEQVSA